MKKLFVWLLVLTMAIALLSCAGKEKKSVSDEEMYLYYGTNLDEFLRTYVQDQLRLEAAKNELVTPYLTVPVLQSDDFVFRAVMVNEYNYFYYYDPVGAETDYFEHETGICVSVSKSDISFAAVMKQHNLTSVDGYAYYAKYNEWFWDDAGHRIGIQFPGGLVIKTAEKLSDYFTFKKIYLLSDDIADPAPIASFVASTLSELQAYFTQQTVTMLDDLHVLNRVVNHTKLNFDNYSIYQASYLQEDGCERVEIYWHMEDCTQEFHGYGNCKWFLLTLNYSPDDLFAEINVTDFEQLDTDLYAENQYNENSLYADQTNITLYRYRLNSNYRVSFTVHNELADHDAVVAQFVELCEEIKCWLSDDNVAA